jgi:hypothetical protein
MEKRLKEEEDLQKQLRMKEERKAEGGRSKKEFFTSLNSWK